MCVCVCFNFEDFLLALRAYKTNWDGPGRDGPGLSPVGDFVDAAEAARSQTPDREYGAPIAKLDAGDRICPNAIVVIIILKNDCARVRF